MNTLNLAEIPVVILAGGLGTRLSEETLLRPKPMVEVSGKPILHHIMDIYSKNGFKKFIICGGYKQYIIKEYFANLRLHQSDVTFNFKTNDIQFHQSGSYDWSVTVVDTGLMTGTWKRLSLIKQYIDNEIFMCTYGDGVGNINLNQLIKSFYEKNSPAIMTITKPQGRFGHVVLGGKDGTSVVAFGEKEDNQGAFINAGFFVFSTNLLDIEPSCSLDMLETGLLAKLTSNRLLSTYIHRGFWHPMDTLRDKETLEKIWEKHKSWEGF